VTTQPRKLSLMGVPLEALGDFRGPDYGAAAGYGKARADFIARRGVQVTELLAAAEPPADPGPHPALREFVVASLVNKLNTGDPLARTVQERTLLAEAHMAFMQYLGDLVADAAQRGMDPPPGAVSAHQPRFGLPTGASLNSRPLWLSQILAGRHARAVPEPAPSFPDPPTLAEPDPVAYTAESSAAYAEALVPATELNRGQGAGRISPVLTLKRLLDESADLTVDGAPEAPQRIEIRPIQAPQSDLPNLANSAEGRGHGGSRMALEAMQLAAGGNPVDELPPIETYVFTPETVDTCLSTMDVMRGFEWAAAVGSAVPSPAPGALRIVDEFGNPIASESGDHISG